MKRPAFDPSDATTSNLIKSKAAGLCRRRGFNRSDRESIENELRVHLWLQAQRYDPTLGTWLTFAARVLDNRCISLWRYRNAARRSPLREEYSLNESVLDVDDRVVQRAETTAEAARDFRQHVNLHLDLEILQDRVLPEAGLVARGLVDGSLAAISREQGWTRWEATSYLEELRQECEDMGLRDYLR